MEKTIKKLLLGASAVMVAALALVPATAYLGSESAYAAESDQKDAAFSVTISSAISLEVTTAPTKLTVAAGEKNEDGTFKAKVKSNKGYNIKITAADSNGGTMKTAGCTGAGIDYKTTFDGGTTGWAIKNNSGAYTELGSTFYSGSATGNDGTETTFNWGVGAGYELPDGEYSATVTLTAATV